MKKLFYRLFIAMSILLLAGCSLAVNDTGPPSPESDPEPDLPEYEIIEDLALLPEVVQNIISYLKAERGFFIFNPQDYDTGGDYYLLVFSGEKPTGGYTISVNSVQLESQTLKIIVEEKEPKASDPVIQVLTYPFTSVKLDRAYDNYFIMNTNGEQFSPIDSKAVPAFFEKEGVYTGRIDNNFIEIEVEGQPTAYMIPEDLHWIFAEHLNEGDNVIFTYFENEHGQRVIIKIDPAGR